MMSCFHGRFDVRNTSSLSFLRSIAYKASAERYTSNLTGSVAKIFILCLPKDFHKEIECSLLESRVTQNNLPMAREGTGLKNRPIILTLYPTAIFLTNRK